MNRAFFRQAMGRSDLSPAEDVRHQKYRARIHADLLIYRPLPEDSYSPALPDLNDSFVGFYRAKMPDKTTSPSLSLARRGVSVSGFLFSFFKGDNG